MSIQTIDYFWKNIINALLRDKMPNQQTLAFVILGIVNNMGLVILYEQFSYCASFKSNIENCFIVLLNFEKV